MKEATITLSYSEFELLKEKEKQLSEILNGKKACYYESYSHPVIYYDLTESETIAKMKETINRRDKQIFSMYDEIKKLQERKWYQLKSKQ